LNTSWRRPLTQTSLLAMEALWAYALVGFFIALTVGGDRPTVIGVGAVVFLSFLVSRLLQGTTMSLLPLRIWGTLLSLLLFYALVRVDFFGDWRLWDFSWADALFNHTEATLNDKANAVMAVPVLWLLWLRGVNRGQQSLVFDEVVNSFATGLVIVAFAELFGPAVDAPGSVGGVAVPYIAIGLLTIAFAHASRSEKEFGRSFGGTWLATVGGAVALMALVALIFVLLDLGSLQNALGDASLAATTAFVHFFSFLAWPFEQFINGLFKGMYWFFHHVYGGQRPERQPAAEGTPPPDKPVKPDGEPPHWLDLLVRIFFAGGIAAVVVFFASVMFLRYARRKTPEEVKESTYQEGRLASDLSNMLGSLLGRLRPSFRSGPPSEPMRRLYFDMLSTAADRGVERRPPETPLDVAPRVGRSFKPEVTNRITDAFDDARYGGVSPPSAEVRRLRDEWDEAKR